MEEVQQQAPGLSRQVQRGVFPRYKSVLVQDEDGQPSIWNQFLIWRLIELAEVEVYEYRMMV